MNKKLDNALDTIYFALMSYCEDCISSDPSEKNKIDKAYKTISQALKGIKNEISK